MPALHEARRGRGGLRRRMRRFVCGAASLAIAAAPVSPAVSISLTAGGVLAVSTAATSAEARDRRIRINDHGAVRKVVLGRDKSAVIDLPADAHDVLVANPQIADAIVRTRRRIYVIGKQIGQTNVFAFGKNGEQIASIDLNVERDISGLVETIARLVPNSSVNAEMINDNVVLTGTVTTPQAAAKAVQLAEVFVTAGEQAQSGASLLAALFGGNTDSRVINLMKITGDDQVHLKVTVAEMSRSIIKQLGIKVGANRNTSLVDGTLTRMDTGIISSTAASDNQFSLKPAPPLNAITGQVMRGLFDLSAEIKALEQTGVMRTLAEPSLTAVSGELAQFRVGGSFSVLQSAECNEDGRSFSFQERDYGIAMAFTPVVLTSGRISLKIRTEVSEPTTVGGQPNLCGNLLGLRQRLADTTVELPSGGSMVIGGLVQDDVRQVLSGVPGASKIPFFGALFRSREFVREESEVVIIVTPYLVRPVAASKLTRPDQNYAPADDAASFLLGRINRVYGVKKGKLPKGRYEGSVGFILD